MKRRTLLLALPLVLACAPSSGPGVAPAPCPAGHTAAVRDVLYFGRSIPGGGEVTDSAWTAFVAEVIAPAFPNGFTVTTGIGQWRGADGKVISERSSIVSLLHPDTQEAEAAVTGLGERYRVRFRQEAVLHEHVMACMELIDGTP
jgi:hypothetical protein